MLLFFFNFKNKLLGNPEGSPWMLAHPGWETLPSLHGWVTAPASFPLPSPLLFLYSHFYMMLADIKFFIIIWDLFSFFCSFDKLYCLNCNFTQIFNFHRLTDIENKLVITTTERRGGKAR